MFHRNLITVGNIIRKYFSPVSSVNDPPLCNTDEEYYYFLANNRIIHCKNGTLNTKTISEFITQNSNRMAPYLSNVDICLESPHDTVLLMSPENSLVYCDQDRTKPPSSFELGFVQDWSVDDRGFKVNYFNCPDQLPVCPSDKKYIVSTKMSYGTFKVSNRFRYCEGNRIQTSKAQAPTDEQMYQFTRNCLNIYKNIDAHWLNFFRFDIPFCEVYDTDGVTRPLNIFHDFIGDHLPLKFMSNAVLPNLPAKFRNNFIFNLNLKLIQIIPIMSNPANNQFAISGPQQKYYNDLANHMQMCPEVFDIEAGECNSFENTNLSWFHTNHSTRQLDCVLDIFKAKVLAIMENPIIINGDTNRVHSITLYQNTIAEAKLPLIYPTVICTPNPLQRIVDLKRYELAMCTDYYIEYIDSTRVAVHTSDSKIFLYEIDDQTNYEIHSPQLPLPFRKSICGSESKPFPTPFRSDRTTLSSRIIPTKEDYKTLVMCQNNDESIDYTMCNDNQVYNFLNGQCVSQICHADEVLHIPFTDSVITCRQGKVSNVSTVERNIFQRPDHSLRLENSVLENSRMIVWEQTSCLFRYPNVWRLREDHYVVGPVCYFQELFQKVVTTAIRNAREIQDTHSNVRQAHLLINKKIHRPLNAVLAELVPKPTKRKWEEVRRENVSESSSSINTSEKYTETNVLPKIKQAKNE